MPKAGPGNQPDQGTALSIAIPTAVSLLQQVDPRSPQGGTPKAYYLGDQRGVQHWVP